MTDAISHLIKLMQVLRDPQTGCSWDRKQTHQSLAKYAIEEAYEVADAARQADDAKLCDELGDLLFQVVFHAQVATERGAFTFDDVAQAISDKLTRRHPHVFGPHAGEMSEEDVAAAWEAIKAAERALRGEAGLLDDVSSAQPAILRAHKIQQRMASVGYDWADANAVLQTLKGEIAELEEAIAAQQPAAITDELGDVLFSCVNLARWLRVDVDDALQQSNDKIAARIAWIETQLATKNIKMSDLSVEQLDRYWCDAKRALTLAP